MSIFIDIYQYIDKIFLKNEIKINTMLKNV